MFGHGVMLVRTKHGVCAAEADPSGGGVSCAAERHVTVWLVGKMLTPGRPRVRKALLSLANEKGWW